MIRQHNDLTSWEHNLQEMFPCGCTRFIESNAIEELLKRGETVPVIDSFSTRRPDCCPADATGCPHSIAGAKVSKVRGNAV